MKIKLLSLILLAGLAGSSCKSKKTTASTPPAPAAMEKLTGTKWQALEFINAEGATYNYSKAYVLTFSADDRLELRLDVNNCMNQYAFAANKLTIDNPFGCTKKCCDSKDGKELSQALKGAWDVSLDANKNLVLKNTDKNTIVWKPSI